MDEDISDFVQVGLVSPTDELGTSDNYSQMVLLRNEMFYM